MKKQIFQFGEWSWFRIDGPSVHETDAFPGVPNACRSWIKSLKEDQNCNLEMDTTIEGQESMWGAIIYHQDIDDQSKQTALQYFLAKNVLITSKVDISLLNNVSEQQLLEKMEKADNAIEGFMLLLGEIVASFLQDINSFENRMHALLWRIKTKNDETVLDQIMHNRHEILVWRNLIIPIIEIRDALLEAFGDAAATGTHYKRTFRRINRCRAIVREYDEEIREMIDLETVISSYRGNEIVKTLTVITMLFTPVAAWGALWGMNFRIMPELNLKYGYLLSLFVIAGTTWGLYYYLKRKNWIGSVLRPPKNFKF